MADEPRHFVFGATARDFDGEVDFLVCVPASIRDRHTLFDALKQRLLLPEYFGKNWDALSECLRDLSWIKHRRVVLLHSDLPCSDPRERRAYVDVLMEAARDWKPEEDHELVAVFPSDCKEKIDVLLKNEAASGAGGPP